MNYKEYFIIFLILLSISSCKKGFNLPEDNPNDAHYSGEDKDKIRSLVFSKQKIICKQVDTTIISNANSIGPGDKVWLGIEMKNTCNSQISDIRGEIKCTSNSVSIYPLCSNCYLIFSKNYSNDYISPHQTAWGEIDNGNPGSYNSTPTFEKYSLEFQVDGAANIGDIIEFQITTKDKYNNIWNDKFTITLQ